MDRVPVVFNPVRGCCATHIVIPKGFVALVNRHGRYVGKWGAGLKWAPPWVNVSHLVPEQFIVYDLMDSHQDKQMDAERRELNDHFAQYGVVITDISITNVHLPKDFADTMQEATVWHNRNEFK